MFYDERYAKQSICDCTSSLQIKKENMVCGNANIQNVSVQYQRSSFMSTLFQAKKRNRKHKQAIIPPAA